MLGRDDIKQEYWHFKDDSSRIYVRKEEQVPIKNQNLHMHAADEEDEDLDDELYEMKSHVITETVYTWFYFDEEEQYL